MIVLMLGVVLALHPGRPDLRPHRDRIDRRVLMVTAAGALPWLVYAVTTAPNSRGRVASDDLAARPQAGGWAGATVLALTVVLLAQLAGTRRTGWRVPLWSAALASAAFGVVSLAQSRRARQRGSGVGRSRSRLELALLLTGGTSADGTGSFDLSTNRPRRHAGTG